MSDQSGQQFGPYQLLRLLGRGGFAEVYLAEHVHLKMHAAVKVLYGPMTTQDVQSFMAEARTIAMLQHPHILRILDFGFEQTLPFFVMEYAAGGTLRDRYPAGSQVPLATVVTYVKQVASALAYAHGKRLIHRDVKPENMLLDTNGAVLLGDFGIVATAHSTASMKTMDQTGTIHYMAPEQIKGQPRPASDQYALAIVVYEWLCGERPFLGDTAIEIAMKQLSEKPLPLRQRLPSLPPIIEQIIVTALAKDPGQRFPDMLAFAGALEQAAQPHSGTTATLPVSPPSQANRAPLFTRLIQSLSGREEDSPPLPPTVNASPLPSPNIFPQRQTPRELSKEQKTQLATYDQTIQATRSRVAQDRLVLEKLALLKKWKDDSPNELLAAYDWAIQTIHSRVAQDRLILEKLALLSGS